MPPRTYYQWHTLHSKINWDLQTLSNWASQWLVQFNPTKSKFLIFSKRAEKVKYSPLYLQGKQIEETSTHKHLGLTINNKMTWDDHIDRTCAEANKRLTIIKRLPKNVTQLTKIHIYKTFIRPILEYSAIIFDNCLNYLTWKMENIQRQAAIAATRAYNNTSHQQLLLECGKTLHLLIY